ncbi:Bug family tripartite tricarboxylate transporter substrate binding protein [Reyranella soli]|jgi:tripartite-type tricarboxylate transporter receptor subunit TctC|uniref:MFS transporter n=1 Tax=Reyranella soli TaxID=1230389 RepID=A0A512NQN6_9HYPH|nr:tripartite tricarboxylate transporter substrate binding protein [Reyranella soli]GEP61256.1 MFS transporter [Reyranella soli]
MNVPKLFVAAMAAFALGVAQAPAQDWPSKPVRFVVPFAAGGSTDVLTRLLCDQLAIELKTPCVVENKGGAGGNVGGQAVATSPPDGYTFLVSAPGVLAYNKILYREMAFDPDKDLDPICLYAFQPNVLVVHPSLPVKSVEELIAYAKANPRKLNYASGGVGSTSHVAGELFRTMAGLEWQHVPYRGTGPSLVDLLAGQVQLTIDNLPAILPHIKTGALRALAISTDKRVPQLPDLPTIAEAGLPGYAAISWQMVAVPTGTPRPIIDRMAATISKLTAEPAFRARVADAGAEPAGGTVDEARAFVKQETVKWREVVLKSGAKAD